jgi:hypothetical protein
MARIAAGLALLLAAAPVLGGPAVVAEAAIDGRVVAEPVIIPFDFGTQVLGSINTVVFTACFKMASSPSGSCDAAGTFALGQDLAAPFYRAGQFRENLTSGVKTRVSLPVSVPAGQRLALYLQYVPNAPGPQEDFLRLVATPAGGSLDQIDIDFEALGINPPPCNPTQELCLNNDRFLVRSHFLTPSADSGAAGRVKLTGDTGYVFFFSPSNVEAVVKVLNACPVNNRYWVFAGGLTDVRTVVTVTDTQRDAVKTYINPQGSPYQPIQDTSAFATCP